MENMFENTNNNSSYIVERATICDATIISDFQIAMALETEGLQLNAETVQNGVESAISDPSKGIYFVSRVNNGISSDKSIVGSMFITIEWSDWHNKEYWWVQSVYVLPEHRDKGVFRNMYAFIRNLARSKDVDSIRLYVDNENHKAQKCYRTVGMGKSHYLIFEESL